MEVPADYYKEGSYYYTEIGGHRVEVMLLRKDETTTVPHISDEGRSLLWLEAKFSTMTVFWDKKHQPWLRLEGEMPELHRVPFPVQKQTIMYYQIKRKQCKKQHVHSSSCVDSIYPYKPAQGGNRNGYSAI